MVKIEYCGVAERFDVNVEIEEWKIDEAEVEFISWERRPSEPIKVMCQASKDGRCFSCTGKALIDKQKTNIGLAVATRHSVTQRVYET